MLSQSEVRETVIQKFLAGDMTIYYSQYNRYYKIISVSKSGKTVKVQSKHSYGYFSATERLPDYFFTDVKITNRPISWVGDRVDKSTFMRNWKSNGKILAKDIAIDDILNLI